MFKKLLTTRSLCLSAIIAALYAALTLLLGMFPTALIGFFKSIAALVM